MRKTVVIVTHDMAEAFALATRVGVLDDGVLAALDAPRDAGALDRSARPAAARAAARGDGALRAGS